MQEKNTKPTLSPGDRLLRSSMKALALLLFSCEVQGNMVLAVLAVVCSVASLVYYWAGLEREKTANFAQNCQ